MVKAWFAAMFALFAARADVGSYACAKCHQEIYDSYRRTAMAQSSGAISQPAPFGQISFAGPGGNVQYRVADTWSATSGDITVTRPFAYFIGSGAVGRSYLSWVDDYLFQAPVSFYSSDQTWRVSPGLERSRTLQVARPIEASCLGCHASRVQAVAGTVNQYTRPPFREDGISCERCHGSGEQHVRSGAKTTIVNPSRLTAEKRDSVCAQCHLSGEVRVAKRDRERPFAPGDALSASVAAFVWSQPRERQVNGHVEELSRSRCSIVSAGKLWCGSCHDLHSTPSSPASFYRERCYGCHNVESCSLPKPERTKAKDNCIACHMPRSGVRDVQHAAYTNHTIPRSIVERKSDRPSKLIEFGKPAATRDLAIAQALVALRENDRALGMQAFPGLLAAWSQDNSDTAAGSQLAQLYDRMNQEDRACGVYAKIAQDTSAPPAALNNWGACLAKAGRLAEAVSFWQDVVRRAPGEESAWTNLTFAQLQLGNPTEAQAVRKRGLRFHPASKKLLEIHP